MLKQVYHSQAIQAWERRWFSQKNSSFGLMQQAAWQMTQYIIQCLQYKKLVPRIAVWCGQGNNAGDGYLVAAYLAGAGYDVEIFAAVPGESADLHSAIQYAQRQHIKIHNSFDVPEYFNSHIDALFGIGLNRILDKDWQKIIHSLNQKTGLKISIDMPSGLQANTGKPLPCAVKADHTCTLLALKAGLYTGQGKEFSGQVQLLSLIPVDDELEPIASLCPKQIQLPKRQASGHKGSYGHVLVVGGHADMGGAVIMAAEAAFAAGAGKVTVVCDSKHHSPILARSPNIMLKDIHDLNKDSICEILNQVDAVCFGMGLGRDNWAGQQFQQWFPELKQAKQLEVVLDADALWFLAAANAKLDTHFYATPHPGEAAKLLGVKVSEVEADRIAAIHQLMQKYHGQWVLKGAGSLILSQQLWICTEGNPGMGTGGMGDVLSGMIAALKAQFHDNIHLHEIISLHAQAGDMLAQSGERGLQAQHMPQTIYQVVNR